jgi:predicted phosphodiesterase
MKLACASDLHVEFHSQYPEKTLIFSQEADVIILAGDIDVGSRAVATVQRIADEHLNASVVWVAGNHEFYRTNIDDQIAKYRASFAGDPRVHYLENDCVEIGGYTFIGCTLWSDCTITGEQHQHRAFDIARSRTFAS